MNKLYSKLVTLQGFLEHKKASPIVSGTKKDLLFGDPMFVPAQHQKARVRPRQSPSAPVRAE